MLFHHDNRNYNEAAGEAARNARAQFEAMIENGRVRAGTTIHKIGDESARAKDFLMKGSTFGSNVRADHGAKRLVTVDAKGETVSIHRHALGQLAEKGGLPGAYVTELQERGEPWALDLLAHNVRELYARDEKRYLVRAVGDEVRGVMSDKFKRIDSLPVVDAIIGHASKLGLLPCDGVSSATQDSIKMILPTIFEPIDHEVMLLGLEWSNSNYGKGANVVRVFMLRLWCTNKATMNDALRQVHLGRRLDDSTLYSERTLQLDTETAISAVGDVVDNALTPEAVARYMAVIKQAHEQKIDPRKAMEAMKTRLLKSEREAIVEAFNSPDVEMMPAGNTAWRLSNAISWIAGKTEDADRRLELEREAGKVLPALAA